MAEFGDVSRQAGQAEQSARQAQPKTPTVTARPGEARLPAEGELDRQLAESFMSRLRRRWQEGRTLLCVGLDVELERIPETVRRATATAADDESPIERAIVAFNTALVDSTADLVCAYKPNSAFYEQYGPEGLRALRSTIAYIQQRYPDIPVLLDAKRGDIGSTSEAYARAAFDVYCADAVTLQPYLGRDAVEPFLQRRHRGVFILARTSNPGSGELQELPVTVGETQEPLYLALARMVARDWNANNNCGLVVGATYPEELRAVREAAGNLPILVPGIGSQGGDLEATVRAGLDEARQGLLISASRSIIYASSGSDFAGAARREAARLRMEIERLRGSRP